MLIVLQKQSELKICHPYGYEDVSNEPVLAYIPAPSSSRLSITSFPPDSGDILNRAASILHVPVRRLLDLNRQSNPGYMLEQAASILKVPLSALIDLGECYDQQSSQGPHLEKYVSIPAPYPPESSGEDVQVSNAVDSPIGGVLPQTGPQQLQRKDGYQTILNTYICEYFLHYDMLDCAYTILDTDPNIKFQRPSPGYRGENRILLDDCVSYGLNYNTLFNRLELISSPNLLSLSDGSFLYMSGSAFSEKYSILKRMGAEVVKCTNTSATYKYSLV